MIAIEDVRARIRGHALVLGVDKVPKGHIRLETAFTYHGGGSIDLFLRCDRPTLTLSDLGQTATMLSYLWDTNMECDILEMELNSLDDLLAGIEKLGREAARITDGRGPGMT